MNIRICIKSIALAILVTIICQNYVLAQSTSYQTIGHANKLPIWYEKMVERQTYPLSWTHGTFPDFDAWKQQARAKVIESFMMSPPFVAFDPVVIGEEDRGTYIARKVVLNITGDSRVLALITVPKSPGLHPAVLLLHDHGGKFDIGKEKVIKPFESSAAKLKSATDWVGIYYGGRFLGDELAKKGYVCMAVDMLNWSDRSGPDPDGVQQALASNFLNLGSSWPGMIAYEDMRAAEFLAKYESVDSTRVAAMGLSVGGFRTWQIAAMSPYISAGVSVCWMSTYVGLMVPGNNQTKGSSAYSMTHPGLAQYLDYADVASIACPKPVLFIAGNIDPLFPKAATENAWAKMRKVWESQNAGDKLVTKMYDAPHEYNLQMQNDAFTWLDKVFKMNSTKSSTNEKF